jgi:hypothetical protein
MLAGIIFLGAGSRVVMRIAAMLDPEAEGSITENGNIVGEVTAGGTLELIFFEGLFGGLMAGFLWVIVREWLPRDSLRRLALGGVVAALLGSFLVVSTENRDFAALGTPAVNIAMFIAIIGLTGCGAAALDGRIERLLPSRGATAVAFGVLAVAGGALALPFVTQAFLAEDVCSCNDPPRLALPFIALAGVASVVSWRQWVIEGRSGVDGPWLRRLGIAGVAAACVVAGIDLIDEVSTIL